MFNCRTRMLIYIPIGFFICSAFGAIAADSQVSLSPAAQKAALLDKIKRLLAHRNFLDIDYTGKVFGFTRDQIKIPKGFKPQNGYYLKIPSTTETGFNLEYYVVTYDGSPLSSHADIGLANLGITIPKFKEMCITKEDLQPFFETDPVPLGTFNLHYANHPNGYYVYSQTIRPHITQDVKIGASDPNEKCAEMISFSE